MRMLSYAHKYRFDLCISKNSRLMPELPIKLATSFLLDQMISLYKSLQFQQQNMPELCVF